MFSIKDTLIKGEGINIDLSGYATKDSVPAMVDFENLKEVVNGKLDSNPVNHIHTISQIDQLQESLDNKLSIPSTQDNKYSYNTLLKDWDKIPYLESVKIPSLDIAVDKNTSGYVFSVDSSGDLHITYNGAVIAFYNKGAASWVFGVTVLNNFVEQTNAVLQNHYEAIMYLANKFSLKDSDETDGNKITLTNS